MKKYFGTAKLTNLIADKTRRLEAKQRNLCEGINGKPRHTPADHERPLQFSHNPWRSRLTILEDVLAKYREGDGPIIPNTLYYIPDLEHFEREFIEAHMPWESSGKILCKTCDREWTATWQRQTGNPAPLAEPAPPSAGHSQSVPRATTVSAGAPTTIEQLTVELIFQRLSNEEVLAGVRKVFPGRASMKTVAWYRSHLIHDRSQKFDRLRAGRIPPASPR